MSCGPPDYLCPACQQPALMVVGPQQAICGNDEGCRVIFWDPSQPDGGMSQAHSLNFDGFADDQ